MGSNFKPVNVSRKNIDTPSEIAKVEDMVDKDSSFLTVWGLINYFTDVEKLGIQPSNKIMKYVISNSYFGSRTLKMKYDKYTKK